MQCLMLMISVIFTHSAISEGAVATLVDHVIVEVFEVFVDHVVESECGWTSEARR